MHVLVLCDRFPYPLENGQNLRIYHYVRRLAARHTFDLLCYGESNPPDEIRPLFRSIRSFPRPHANVRAGLRRVLDAFRVDGFFAQSDEAGGWLRTSLGNCDWDLLWVSGWDMIVNVPDASPVPVLMDAVDDGVLEHVREMRRARSMRRFARTAKRLFMNFRFERRYFGARDACLFVSEVDARFFERISPGTPTFVVHNGVDVDFFKPDATSCRDSSTIVFEGNMSFPPNEDAATFLVQDVLPRVRAEVPEARVLLVGKDPSSAVKGLAGEHVEVTGFVPDVRPYLREAAVFACPMRKGAGIKNKVLQAWAMGMPVVATSAATGGLDAQDGRNILVRDEPEAFAAAVVLLLRAPDRRAALCAEARRTAETGYAWDRQAMELERVMSRVARRSQPMLALAG